MKSPGKPARIIGPIVAGLLLLAASSLSLKVFAAPAGQGVIAQAPADTSLPWDTHKWPLALPFSDEFDGNELDLTIWDVIRGNPRVDDGRLLLPGGTTKAEVQSKAQFQSGVLQVALESSGWKPQSQFTDSSFGFEIWTGANGQCHYGVIFIASGHLGVLHSQPAANDNCSGDPEQQVYLPVSNWDAVRAAGTVHLTLTWSPNGVILYVSDDGSNHGQVSYMGEANPAVPLEVRLNADTDETYAIDYVRIYNLEERTLLVDDFTPQPRQGMPFWPHNRLGGDRGAIGEPKDVSWGNGVVTATISGTNTSIGVWTALNHPIADHNSIDFSAIFPTQIKPEFQGQITGLQIEVLTGTGTFQVELKAQDPDSPTDEIVKWQESVPLTGTSHNLNFSLPISLGKIQNLNWFISGTAGDFVVVDRVTFTATVTHLDVPKRSFLWSYAMLLNNWDPASGMTRDSAYWAANKFDNISASGMQAAAAVIAWRLGFISEASATEIVTRTTQALLELERADCSSKLWPHFVEAGQIISGTEWSSIDTIIAGVALLEARQALGFDTSAVEAIFTDINWDALRLPDGHISHGYWSDCQPIEPGGAGGWRDFGTESWLVNLGYAVATGTVAEFDHTPPTYNGSGFIDELAWLLVPPPQRDRWGTTWWDYRQQTTDCQLTYYKEQTPDCLYSRVITPYKASGLFGLSAAEVSELAAVSSSQTYQAFGIGGKIPPNDGTGLLGYAVIVPHYLGLIASLRPTQTFTAWQWIEMNELFTPLNNVESFGCHDQNKSTCEQLVWNALKGSWNLSLQALGWGRYLVGDDNPLYASAGANELLKRGYQVMTQCSQGPISTPSSETQDLDEEAGDWGIFCEESPTGGLPTWVLSNVSTPSLDGRSLQCAITGGDPYSNIHCYRNFPPEPAASAFTLTVPFVFTSPLSSTVGVCNNQGGNSVVQAIEFSMSKWHQGQRYEFALQWQNVEATPGDGAPQWRYWIGSQWVPISPTVTHCLKAEQWYTLTLEGGIVNGQVHYHSFTITDTTHMLDLTVPAVPDSGSDRLAIAVQLDGNFQADPYDVFIDQVKFVRNPAPIFLPIVLK